MLGAIGALHAASACPAATQTLLPSCTALVRLLSSIAGAGQQSCCSETTTTTSSSSSTTHNAAGAFQPQANAVWLLQHSPLQGHLRQQQQHFATRADRPTRPRQQQQQQQQQQQRQPQPHHQQQHQQRRQPHSAHPSAAAHKLLTEQIMSAATPKELLEVVVYNHESLNHIHLIAAMTRAAMLWPKTAAPADPLPAADTARASHIQQLKHQHQPSSSGGSSEVTAIDRQQLERLMMQLVGPFVRALPDYSVREISTALRSYGHCGLRPPASMLEACVQELTSWDKMQQAPPKYVASLVFEAAKLGCMDHQLYSRAAAAALNGHIQEYTPVQLATFTWAVASAGYDDRVLGLTLTARAVELLQRQLRQPAAAAAAGPSSSSKSRGKKRIHELAWLFAPTSLTRVVWGSASMGWLAATPELMHLAVVLAVQEPLVYDFNPRQAANFVWSYATTLGGGGQQRGAAADAAGSTRNETLPDNAVDAAEASSSSSSRRNNNTAEAVQHVSDSPLLDPQQVWQACLRVAAGSLRRLDEADPASLGRMVWSLATLSGWVRRRVSGSQQAVALDSEAAAGGAGGVLLEQQTQQPLHNPAAAQQAVEEGTVVFDQVCNALRRLWHQQPRTFTHSVAITAWGLVAAEKSGLWQLLAPPPGSDSATAAPSITGSGASAPTLLLLQLLDGIHQLGTAHQQLSASTVADLAVALAEVQPRLQSADALWQRSSASGGGPLQLLPHLAAAVDVLAAAGWQHAGTPGALEVRDVSRLLLSFHQLQVNDAGLYPDLLQHLSSEALKGCSNKSLVGALRAAAVLSAAQPDLLASGSVLGGACVNLLVAARERLPSKLSAAEKAHVGTSVRMLCSAGQERGVFPDELLQEVTEAVADARGGKV